MRKRRSSNGFAESPYLSESLQVAYYHCVLEMPLKAIAEMLGRSPATITRRLDEVRSAGWLRDHPEFTPPPDIWRELQGRMTCGDVEQRLMERLGAGGVRRITVLPSTPRQGRSPQEGVAEAVERIGRFAAQRLCENLSDGSHAVGINWGWSVRHCVSSLRPPRPNPELRFIPLVGSLSLDENDPHYEEAIDCSSNRLAQMAASAFGSPRAPRLTTPAYIPRRFHADSRGLRAIRDFIESDISYRRIFGGRDESGLVHAGLIDQVDTLVTGLSSIDVETLPDYRPGLITQDDVAVLQRAGVVGDLALHLLVDEDEATPPRTPEQRLVASINGLIVGASPGDFCQIASRAREVESRGLGVVVLAAGAWKAKTLIAAIQLGAVNELVTDLDTALAMGKLLGVTFQAGAHLPAGRR